MIDDPVTELEKRKLANCPENGLHRHKVIDMNFCMYKGIYSCEFREPIPLSEGAGFLCIYEELENDG